MEKRPSARIGMSSESSLTAFDPDGFGRIDCGTDLGQNGPCRNCNLSSEKEGHAHSYISTNYVERDPLCVHTTF